MTDHERSPQIPYGRENPRILSVSELNRLAKEVLERSFPLFWVSGEISNFTRAASGHWYFSLKDAGAQVRCVMFKSKSSYLNWIPKEGDKVEARALVSLYEARGDFQLTIEFIQRAGLGALFEAFEALKRKLSQEGLFDASRKKAIPSLPKQIGIVTSADAAALRDLLTTLKRRMPSIPIIIYPTPVQGKGAAEKIAAAIQTAHTRAECDVLIIARGGGSIEDLWSFNEEVVARAIANCNIPTISGVGHETDFTIADFVADQRAATPTAAAELATPDSAALLHRLQQISTLLQRLMQTKLERAMQQLDYLEKRLRSPLQQTAHQRTLLMQLGMRLNTAIQKQMQQKNQNLTAISQSLQHLNPLAVLGRGYALVQKTSGTVILDSKQLSENEILEITFAKGAAEAQVLKVKNS